MKKRKLHNKILALLITFSMLIGGINISMIESKAADEENYAKLLQYSLYFYDANMCGAGVDTNSLLDWRGNCHTDDTISYTRKDGVTLNIDLTGGFHDAGDHVKFGLPESYAAFTLGMSYDTDKAAYEACGQTGHLKNITTYFADYLVKCAVLDANGNVESYCVQVGQGGGGFDHGYWGAPEDQKNDRNNRPIFFTNESEPSTDIVSLSAAALAMQYKNFGGASYLDMSKKLFEYAKNNNKAVNKTASAFYSSSGWEDDYCLAAIMLYNITGESSYLDEYNRYCNEGKATNVWWPYGWDNVAPAVYYYSGKSSELSNIMNTYMNNKNPDGFVCVNDWGSARYNTSMQYTGLLYDKSTGSSTYREWAKSQMSYLLGNNPSNQCYVVGYNEKSAKYPHHRAASGYTGGPKGTTTQAHVLTGALVGGPKNGGAYTDTADDYQCNEVAIDYNATLVAAAAALYTVYSGNGSQSIDANYYNDGNSGNNTGGSSGGTTGGNSGGTTGGNLGQSEAVNFSLLGIYIAGQDRNTITMGACTNLSDVSSLEFSWWACKDGENWIKIQDWTKGNQWITWKPTLFGDFVVVAKVRASGGDGTVLETATNVTHHPYIKGKCQMPYEGEGGGYLIGVESFENPNQSYRYEMLILDCTLLAQGLPAWTYTTGQCGVASGNALWTVWQPQYGYYWTLFRVYDKDGIMLDEACYGFVNAY